MLIEQGTPAASSCRERVRRERRDRAGPHVRHRAHVAHDAAVGELARAAPGPRPRGCRGAAGRRRARRARRGSTPVRRPRPRAAPSRARRPWRPGTRRRTARAGAAPRARRARVPPRRGPRTSRRSARSRAPASSGEAARDVGGEPHDHAGLGLGRGGAVAEAGEHLVPRRAGPHPLGRGEDPLDVDRAVRGRLAGVVDDDLAEVGVGPDRVRRHDPELDEVVEVAELVERGQLRLGRGGQLARVAAGDAQQRRRAHGALEVDVQLDLRIDGRAGGAHDGIGSRHPVTSSCASTDTTPACQTDLGSRRSSPPSTSDATGRRVSDQRAGEVGEVGEGGDVGMRGDRGRALAGAHERRAAAEARARPRRHGPRRRRTRWRPDRTRTRSRACSKSSVSGLRHRHPSSGACGHTNQASMTPPRRRSSSALTASSVVRGHPAAPDGRLVGDHHESVARRPGGVGTPRPRRSRRSRSATVRTESARSTLSTPSLSSRITRLLPSSTVPGPSRDSRVDFEEAIREHQSMMASLSGVWPALRGRRGRRDRAGARRRGRLLVRQRWQRDAGAALRHRARRSLRTRTPRYPVICARCRHVLDHRRGQRLLLRRDLRPPDREPVPAGRRRGRSVDVGQQRERAAGRSTPRRRSARSPWDSPAATAASSRAAWTSRSSCRTRGRAASRRRTSSSVTRSASSSRPRCPTRTTMFDRTELVHAAVRGGFAGIRMLVVGDVMLDRYLIGDVARISPEAPVPVVRLARETRLGGWRGQRRAQPRRARRPRRRRGLDRRRRRRRAPARAARPRRRPGPGRRGHPGPPDHHQDPGPLRPAAARAHRRRGVGAARRRSSARPGTTGSSSCSTTATTRSCSPTTPRACCPTTCAGASSSGAASVASRCSWTRRASTTASTSVPPRSRRTRPSSPPPRRSRRRDPFELIESAARLRHLLDLDFVTLTRGEAGISLIEESGTRHVPARAREVFDVSGAGDTAIATLAAGIATGLDAHDAAVLANLAAGIIVGKSGTVPIRQDQLLDALGSGRGRAAAARGEARQPGGRGRAREPVARSRATRSASPTAASTSSTPVTSPTSTGRAATATASSSG